MSEDTSPAEETSRIPWWKPDHAKPLTDTERAELKQRVRQIIGRNLKPGHAPEPIDGYPIGSGSGEDQS